MQDNADFTKEIIISTYWVMKRLQQNHRFAIDFGYHVAFQITWHFVINSLGEGNSNPLQYSCLGNLMDRGAWWATIHGVTKELDTN